MAKKFTGSKAAHAFVAVAVSALTHASCMSVIYTEEKTSVAGQLRDGLFTLRDAAKDTGAYLADCSAVFGNGQRHTSKDYDGGTLRQQLSDAGVPLDSIKVYLSHLRKVGSWLADPANNAKRCLPNGEALSLVALYKVATVKAAPTAPDATAPAGDYPSTGESIVPLPTVDTVSQMITKFGILEVLAECARILKTDKRTKTDGIAVAAVVEHVGAQKQA